MRFSLGVLALLLVQISAAGPPANCKEEDWCAHNLKDNDDGTKHANCPSWTKECPCTCFGVEPEVSKDRTEL